MATRLFRLNLANTIDEQFVGCAIAVDKNGSHMNPLIIENIIVYPKGVAGCECVKPEIAASDKKIIGRPQMKGTWEGLKLPSHFI